MKFFWLITGTLASGLVLGWLATKGFFYPRQSSADPPISQLDNNTPDPASTPTETHSLSADPGLNRSRTAVFGFGTLTNWEDKVEHILNSDAEDDLKARQMMALFPRLPLEGQVEVAQELGHMLSDDDYSGLAGYLTNPTMPEPVLDALLAGLSGRTDAIKLPLLLSVAQDDQHPKHEEARDQLEGFLGTDYGTNWDQWSMGVEQRLRNEAEAQQTASPEQ